MHIHGQNFGDIFIRSAIKIIFLYLIYYIIINLWRFFKSPKKAHEVIYMDVSPSEQQRRELIRLYSALADEQLLTLKTAGGLTGMSVMVLHDELIRRNLDASGLNHPKEASFKKESLSKSPSTASDQKMDMCDGICKVCRVHKLNTASEQLAGYCDACRKK